MTRNAHLCLAVAVAVAIVTVDQLTKAWVLGAPGVHENQAWQILPIFAVTLTRNYSMSFGLIGSGPLARAFLVVFPFLVVAGLLTWVRRSTSQLLSIALGFVTGGALGNAIDRVHHGWVVDFLDFSDLHFPWVFNAADSAISIGVVILLLHYARKSGNDGRVGN